MSLLVVDEGMDSDETPDRVQGPRCPWMVDNTRVRQFFRFLSLINLLVLLFSVPISENSCSNSNSTSTLVQLSVITSLDALLALLFTLQFVLRLRYFVAMRKPLRVRVEKRTPCSCRFLKFCCCCLGRQNCLYVDKQQRTFARHWDYIRLCNIFCITFSLWWSVAVGVSPCIHSFFDG